MSPIKKLIPDSNRAHQLKTRIREYGEADVLRAIDNIKNSSFLLGQNDRGWMITFDWFVKPNNFAKVLEGQYDARNPATGNSIDFLDLV